MIYNQEKFTDIPADYRSLVVSFANLLEKMDSEHPSDPAALYNLLTSDDDMLDWWSLAEYVQDLDIQHVEPDAGIWPDTSLSIVRFKRLDEAAAGFIDHYCLVADHRAHAILDPLDGKIKLASTYGAPCGWASYMKIMPDPKLDKEEARILAEAGNNQPGTYIIRQGENLWDAARKLSISAEELIKLNNIEDPRKVKPGHRIRLPIAEVQEKKVIRYELLESPEPMHVSKPGGTRKFSFGYADKWDDIHATGRTHKENSNVNIVAIAHVELKDENTTAAYYMDRVDLGNYKISGFPQFTTGFNHSHLSKGHVVPNAVTAPKLEAIEAIDQAEVAAAAMAEDDRPVKIEVKAVDVAVVPEKPTDPLPQPMIHNYRSTLIALKPDASAMTFMSEENLMVHEIERRRAPKPLRRGQFINISYTFEKDGVLYGLPTGTEKNEFWYAIPMDGLTSEDALFDFNAQLPLSERIAMRQELTIQEQGVQLLSKFLSQGTRLRVWIKNRKTLRRR